MQWYATFPLSFHIWLRRWSSERLRTLSMTRIEQISGSMVMRLDTCPRISREGWWTMYRSECLVDGAERGFTHVPPSTRAMALDSTTRIQTQVGFGTSPLGADKRMNRNRRAEETGGVCTPREMAVGQMWLLLCWIEM
ncbi:hypothetical protein ARMGADRAFT_158465 [Armillaria gallica]|uniref:Uncharacterized protein n=1 Tax=Armillaria gallica TaxID=47427 RepID=A0A2H3CT48_ARMGA|nr:hypothetical protein ARMGADRAFT_158465 [Armillaria gallica]